MNGGKNVARRILRAPISHMKVNSSRVQLNLLVGIAHRGIVTSNKAEQPLEIGGRF